MIETVTKFYNTFSNKVGMSRLRFLVTIFCSCFVGFVASYTYISATQPPIVHRNDAKIFKYVNGVTMYGLYVDRFRASWCPINPSRIITTEGTLNGKPFPMTYPLYTQNFTWPYLGHQVFGILFTNLPPVLPNGHWALTSSYITSGCHWYSNLWRPQIQIQNAIDFDVVDGQIYAPNMLTVEAVK